MMKASRTTLIFLSLLAVAGCSNMSRGLMGIGPTLTGSVTDLDGNPIEHIQATLEWDEMGIKDIVYTSSDGIFKSQAYLPVKGDTSVRITLEDIDGEENGGIFEVLTETVTILEEDAYGSLTEGEEVNLQMAFHLSHATL